MKGIADRIVFEGGMFFGTPMNMLQFGRFCMLIGVPKSMPPDRETESGSSQTRQTRFQYDAVGNQTAVIDPLGRLSSSQYDRLDRVVKTTAPDSDGAGPLLPEITLSAYDSVGNLVSQTNGAGETERFAYDSRSQLVWSADGRGDETTRRYDAAGNLVRLVDPAGNLTTYAYDGLDRLTTETTASGVRTREYNALGQLAFATDRNGRTTAYSFDRLDRKTGEKWYADRTAAASGAGFSEQLQWLYDELGRLNEDRFFHYSAPSVQDHRITRSYVYDGLDRLTESSNQSLYNNSSFRSATWNGGPTPAVRQTYAYAYDSSGLVETRRQFIAGLFAAESRSTYNAFGELARREEKDVDAASVASAILDFESTDAVFSYLGDGSLASTTRYTDWDAALPGGAGHRNRVQTTYAYDGAGRLKNIAHGQSRRTTASWPAAAPLLAFAYDGAGRINSQGTDWNTALAGLTTRADETQTFEYDAAGQLLGVTSNLSGQGAGYDYGPNGNRTNVNEPGGGSDSYVTAANNRVSQDSTYTYEYDNEGNLVYSYVTSDFGNRTYYTWDHRNRLTKVSHWNDDHEMLIVDYRYNAADELVYRNVSYYNESPEFEHYLVESGQRTLTFEQDSDGDVKRRTQYGPTGEVLFDQVFDATGSQGLQGEQDLLLPLGDHQHSTRVVLAHDVSDATYVRQSLDYAQFGRVTATLGANGAPDSTGVVTAFAHHGSLLDVATGLQLKSNGPGGRWYSPDLGRFISEDPIQDGTNWYLFAGNNPVIYADPTGLSMQGYPLNGGYSGNVTRQPTIKPGYLPTYNAGNPFASTTFGGFVDGERGAQILGGGFGPAPGPVGSIASYQAAAGRTVSRQAPPVASKPIVAAAPTSSGWLSTIGGALRTAGSIGYETVTNYPSYLGTELVAAGRTIVATGRSAGDFVGDHASMAYHDPRAEATRVKQSAVQTAVGIKNTAVYVGSHPIDAARGAGNAAINYADRLTTDPNVSGELLGNGTVAWATGGATAGGGQLLGRGLNALRYVPTGPSKNIVGLTIEQATQLEQRLLSIPGAKQVRAFGSRTKGTSTAASDLDIALIGQIDKYDPITKAIVREVQKFAKQLGIGNGKGLLPLDITPATSTRALNKSILANPEYNPAQGLPKYKKLK
jgi:RHS repeat-associated protein